MEHLNELIINLEKLNGLILISVDRQKTKKLEAEKVELVMAINKQCQVCQPKNFNHLIMKYLNIQQSFRDQETRIYATQLIMKNPNLTMEEATTLIKTGKIDTEHILCLSNVNLFDAQETLNYITLRHKEILKLEKSINELKELFISTYAMTMNQGETIDCIKNHTDVAKQHISGAKRELILARK